MTEEFEVQGQHDRELEHAAERESLGRWVAVFTAVLATIGAIVSYQNGNSESRGLEFKNEAILKKSEASDQWSYYQAKSIKETIVRSSSSADVAQAERYAKEKADIEKTARALDAEARALDEQSEQAIRPHHRLAQALVLVQVAIALAALTVLTRQRWMLALSGVSAAAGIAFWILAWFPG